MTIGRLHIPGCGKPIKKTKIRVTSVCNCGGVTEMSLTAEECKARIKRLLYSKDYAGVIEEVVNIWHADIVAAKWNGEVNEFEIKVSLADLRGEIKAIKRALQGNIYKQTPPQRQYGFTYNNVEVDEKVSLTKLEKHHHYLVEDKQKAWYHDNTENTTESHFVPCKFYFAVPSSLIAPAKLLLDGVPNYGLLDIETEEFAKSAKKLARANVRSSDLFNMFTRSCTELRQTEGSLKHYSDLHENGVRVHVKRKYVWRDYRGESHEDWR